MSNFEEFSNTTSFHLATDFTTDQRTTFGIIVTTFLTFALAMTAFLGNAAVVIVTMKFENLRSQMNNFPTVVLSVIDMLTGLAVIMPAGISIAVDYWPFGPIACRLHSTAQYCCACSSSSCLAVISLDRAIAIKYPLQYPTMVTLRTMLLMCGYALTQGIIIGCIVGCPDWIEWTYWEGMCGVDFDYEGIGVYNAIWLGFSLCFFIPAMVILSSNALIIVSARKSQTSVIVPMGESGTRPVVKKRSSIWQNKTITSMMVVVAIYYLAFAPYSCVKMVNISLPDVYVPGWVNTFTAIAIFCSSASNPFIYAIFRSDYRNAFKKLPNLLRNGLSFR